MKISDDTVFRAIADPTRRRILDLLSQSARSVKDITATFDISQPAVSQHLRQLRQANLVTSERIGVEHRYSLTGAPLREVFEWSARYRRFFDPSGHVWSFAAPRPAKKTKGSQRYGS